MGNFCGKCGNMLDKETGLCPVCDKVVEKVAEKKEFCVYCGNVVDNLSGFCSVCGAMKNSGRVDVPANPPQPVKEKPAKKKGNCSAGRTVAIVLLSVLLFFTSFSAVTMSTVRNVTDKDTIMEILDNVDLYEVIDSNYEIKVREGGRMSLYEYFDYYFSNRDESVNITERKFRKFIDKSSFKEFLAEKAEVLINDIVYDDNEFEFEKHEFRKLLVENEDVFEEIFDVEITDEVVDHLTDVLYDQELLGTISADAIEEAEDDVYYSIRYGLSPLISYALIAISLLLVILIIVIKVRRGILAVGIVSTITGGILTVMWLASYIASTSFKFDLISTAIITIFSSGLVVYIGLLVIGVLALTGLKITSLIIKKKA